MMLSKEVKIEGPADDEVVSVLAGTAGVESWVEFGAVAGVESWVELGAVAGVESWVELGAVAGVESWVELGAVAGVEGGVEGGVDGGVEGGVEALGVFVVLTVTLGEGVGRIGAAPVGIGAVMFAAGELGFTVDEGVGTAASGVAIGVPADGTGVGSVADAPLADCPPLPRSMNIVLPSTTRQATPAAAARM
jgi:hypothetical protein